MAEKKEIAQIAPGGLPLKLQNKISRI